MSVGRRKARNFRKRLIWYVLYLLFLGFLVLSYYLFNVYNQPEFISPLVKGDDSSIAELEKKLRIAKIAFSQIEQNFDSSYTISQDLGVKIVMSSKKSIDQQISSLQRILRELTIKGHVIKTIDFRFEKPVIVFE